MSAYDLFAEYTDSGRLKKSTLRDYREAVSLYLYDWLNLPVADIKKQMVEKRFVQIRDKGSNGGNPTL